MRVLVALVTCKKPEYAMKRARCFFSWGTDIPVGWDFLEVDGGTFGTSDDYEGLSDKVKAICAYPFRNQAAPERTPHNQPAADEARLPSCKHHRANCPKTIPRDWTVFIGRKSGRLSETYPPSHYPLDK